MPAILIKGVPEKLHRRLKQEAAERHRSMAGHALALIEEGLARTEPVSLPKPVKPRRPLTQALLTRGIKAGRR